MKKEITIPDNLDPDTQNLIVEFAEALAAKLTQASVKHGYTNGWLISDWEAECNVELRRHLEKGDPRDVAAYCAFMWKRGWDTSTKNILSRKDARESVLNHYKNGQLDLSVFSQDEMLELILDLCLRQTINIKNGSRCGCQGSSDGCCKV